MKFDKLHATIPYAVGGKEKVLTMNPYNAVTLALPGRHSDQTTPVGGDFVVMVTDAERGWVNHQFTHTDIFEEIQRRFDADVNETQKFMKQYFDVVVKGLDPLKQEVIEDPLDTLNSRVLLCALQCLAVAEFRRYAQYESKFGGRYLPLRFAAGIAEGRWTAHGAADKQRRGRIGVEWLEKDHGTPQLTKELMT